MKNPFKAIAVYAKFITSVPTKREQALKDFQDAEILFLHHAKATLFHQDAAIQAALTMRKAQTELSQAVLIVNRTEKETFLSNPVFSPPLNSEEF